ncbi:sirohydrochlorin cobaltochelatase, partial [Selenomonas sp.]|uniref:sirohydrochlorin cobaltochelatase n=1 Tax=Selenomonas sp. TaxID=2053611 RepID=UPI003FA33F29
LVMSFGTTFKETREKTILAVVEEIRREHPNAKVMLAFTSHIVIERVKANEGISYPTPEEALQKLKDDGYKREVFEECRTWFYRMTLGTPLVYWQGQEEKRDDVADVMTAVAKDLPPCAADEAVLLMAHGTPHPANAYYTVMQERLEQQGQHHIYIYSVEGRPHLDDVLPKLKKACIKKVTLVPLMLVAGDHATNDMAGDAPDSHKAVLEREGFVVQTILRGIGENDAVRKIFTARAQEAYEALYDGSLCNDV